MDKKTDRDRGILEDLECDGCGKENCRKNTVLEERKES
jgi:hypothetical protein